MQRYTLAEVWNKFCCEEAENYKGDAYFGYSGRCMYGKRVMAITTNSRDATAIMQRLGMYIARHGLSDTVDLKQDSMGLGVVVYPADSDYYLEAEELDALRAKYGKDEEEEQED